MTEREDMNTAEEKGQVIIADEVITIIAGIAAMEIEGVDSMYGGWSGELFSMMGVRDLSKGVKTVIEDDEIRVRLSLNVKYGYSIPKVTKSVQERVITSIESMTGMTVREVNVDIVGVSAAKD